jgi:hypothetical protein
MVVSLDAGVEAAGGGTAAGLAAGVEAVSLGALLRTEAGRGGRAGGVGRGGVAPSLIARFESKY